MRLIDLDRVFSNDRPAADVRPFACVPKTTPADLSAEWHVVWDERAAVMEYEGGLSRERAEHLALLEIVQQMRGYYVSLTPPAHVSPKPRSR